MARIGILTCSNCTQDTNCAAVVCLGDMRKPEVSSNATKMMKSLIS